MNLQIEASSRKGASNFIQFRDWKSFTHISSRKTHFIMREQYIRDHLRSEYILSLTIDKVIDDNIISVILKRVK